MKNSKTEKKVLNGNNDDPNQDLLPLSFVGDNEAEPGNSDAITRSADTSANDGLSENPEDTTSPPSTDNVPVSSENKSREKKVETVADGKQSNISEPEKPEINKRYSKPKSNGFTSTNRDFAFGKYLQEKRVDLKLSVAQVEGAIKIRKSYINALEAEDFTTLPPPVYILAYARKLCKYYEIPEQDAGTIIDNIRCRLEDMTFENLPPRFHMEREGGEDNERKLRRMVWGFALAVISFVVLVTVAVLMITGGESTKQEKKDIPAGEVIFDTTRLNQLLVQQTVEMTELPVSPDV